MIEKLKVPTPGAECPAFGPGSKDWVLIDAIRKINELVDVVNMAVDLTFPPEALRNTGVQRDRNQQ